ncbi:MAG: hypothetical protein WCL50_02075, partial [Spirochaetota bacterium]
MEHPVELGLYVAVQLRPHKAGFRREDVVIIRVAGPGGIEKTRHGSTIGTIREGNKPSPDLKGIRQDNRIDRIYRKGARSARKES